MADPQLDVRLLVTRIEERMQAREAASASTAAAPPAASHQFEELAALSGRFSPADLLPSDVSEDTRREVLSHAVDICTVEATSAGVRWVMRPDIRRATLDRLQRTGGLNRVLTGPLPSTDQFGELLRAVLRQDPAVERSGDNLVTLKAVADELAGTDLPRPDPEALRQRIEVENFRREYLTVDPFFVGRTAELDRLREFLARPASQSQWSALVVTGLGGAGKSALLTRFLHDVEQSRAATLAVFDFDRPGLSPDDHLWLNAELARQVGRQHSEAEPMLREKRRQAQQNYEQISGPMGSKGEASRGLESVGFDRSTVNVLYAVQNVLASAPSQPLLVVFDTLELVTDSGGRGALREWVALVADVLSPTPLRLILSGRLFDDDRDAYREWGSPDVLELYFTRPGVRHPRTPGS